ncbi:DUF2975 domain-containing protein [Catelliglobosispora koreensis]|uniref:DUF2975 domain-containing protein n=1 Tax=Catelliglobosispora koreensis TaxID=129052 RepID=UPI000378784E|nr:DUF2975 domain-containing protein [Catelliglobosispora koreensis]
MTRKPDWLAELQGLLTVVLAVLGAVALFSIASLAFSRDIVVTVPASTITAGLPAGATPTGDLDVLIPNATTAQIVAHQLTSLPTFAVAAAVLTLLWKALRRARREDPFSAGTVRSLRVIGAVAVTGILAQVIETAASAWLSSNVLPDGGWSTTLDLASAGLFLLAGFGFFAIAEIINRGLAMRAELETLV